MFNKTFVIRFRFLLVKKLLLCEEHSLVAHWVDVDVQMWRLHVLAESNFLCSVLANVSFETNISKPPQWTLFNKAGLGMDGIGIYYFCWGTNDSWLHVAVPWMPWFKNFEHLPGSGGGGGTTISPARTFHTPARYPQAWHTCIFPTSPQFQWW